MKYSEFVLIALVALFVSFIFSQLSLMVSQNDERKDFALLIAFAFVLIGASLLVKNNSLQLALLLSSLLLVYRAISEAWDVSNNYEKLGVALGGLVFVIYLMFYHLNNFNI